MWGNQVFNFNGSLGQWWGCMRRKTRAMKKTLAGYVNLMKTNAKLHGHKLEMGTTTQAALRVLG